MTRDMLEKLWKLFKDSDTKSHKESFFRDAQEFGELVAIYNLGFLVGWDDRDSKDE